MGWFSDKQIVLFLRVFIDWYMVIMEGHFFKNVVTLL